MLWYLQAAGKTKKAASETADQAKSFVNEKKPEAKEAAKTTKVRDNQAL